jgi:sterol desaturase/sphingolipid hydroxylase (fatty acid hydroxylase superfamily)
MDVNDSATQPRPAPLPGARRRETREETIARVVAEQERLHPTPAYTPRSKRRLRIYLVAVVPISVALGWLASLAFGWSPLEWIGFGAGLVLALAYIGYVLITERDDGRIHDSVRRLVDEMEAADRA